MANYIKSHSNYVLKKKHQNVSDGTIWERDITTIGGVNYFAPGQTPIYRDNNFIITVRNDGSIANQYNQSKWVESTNSGDSKIWTLEDVNKVTSNLDEQNDTKIVIKQDYYDFCDFAYYGSLTELFRSSITDIIDRFPGELYGTSGTVYYETTEIIDGESYTTTEVLGENELKNPFGINIHSAKKPIGANPLKYFVDGGYENYDIYEGNTYIGSANTWISTCYYTESNPKLKTDPNAPKYINYSATTTSNPTTCFTTVSGTASENYYPCETDKFADITISASSKSYSISGYIGNNGSLYYFSDDCKNGVHIRPKEEILNQFYNECDAFQRLLMNSETSPKYKADFSVIYEDEHGYYRRMESFIFPTSDGGYNIDPSAYGFNDYTARLSRIGEFYDERFTDNMWRSMTHEAIKNFDWTRTREYVEGDAEEYVIGGERIQKALRIFAREFDEVKAYIDSINSVNRVTYDDRNNLPNYFLTDTCENDGWDIVQVIPYFTTSATTKEGIVVDVFTQDNKKFVTPYSGASDEFFITCCSDAGDSLDNNCRYYSSVSSAKTPYYSASTAPSKCKIIARAAPYKDTEHTYTYMDVNNEFLRRLKLNSRYIWRHKGTIEGIEMILAMFGLKSDRWCKKLSADTACKKLTPDYTITEYTRSTSGITDEWDEVHQMHKYDWVNSTKTINYDYRTISTYNPKGNIDVTYLPYQGLPVKYIDNGDKTRTLYPNFEKYEQYDGNPYFQMNGGWLAKTVNGNNTSGNAVSYDFQYDNDGQPLFVSGNTLYKETVRSIRRVKNLNEMLSIPSSQLKDGSICFVEKVDNNVLVVDGEVFKIHDGNFITLTRSGGLIKVGNKYFDDKITVYSKSGEPYTYTLDDKLDGYEVYAYIILDETTNEYSFMCKNGSYSIDLARPITLTGSNYSNYFMLNDIEYSGIIASLSKNAPCNDGDEKCLEFKKGWLRLSKDSCDYKKINTIWNYYKGNNPHNGNLSYDSGDEYYEYFKHLFKYPYENDLFDDRCYDNYYYEIDEAYSGAAFSAITELTADTKVHYFGNYTTSKQYVAVTNNQGVVTEKIYVNDNSEPFTSTTEAKLYLFNHKEISGYVDTEFDSRINFGTGNTEYKIGGGIKTKGEIQPYNFDNQIGNTVTNRIMNDKRIKLSFNVRNDYSTPDDISGDYKGKSELKFIDEIVMNYLTQLVPSTAIFEVEYKFENGGLPNKPCGEN